MAWCFLGWVSFPCNCRGRGGLFAGDSNVCMCVSEEKKMKKKKERGEEEGCEGLLLAGKLIGIVLIKNLRDT